MSNKPGMDPNPLPAAEAPRTPLMLEPEEVVDSIQLLSSQLEEVTPLTPEQKRILREQARKQSDAIVASSINVIGALDKVAQAVGLKPEEVRRLQTDWSRWNAVSGVVRALLNGIDGANLIRRQRLSLICAQAYAIGVQLARDPANSVLVPHIQEVKRLKSFANRRKTAEDPQPAAPAEGTPPAKKA